MDLFYFIQLYLTCSIISFFSLLYCIPEQTRNYQKFYESIDVFGKGL